jgi:hypothetical protein
MREYGRCPAFGYECEYVAKVEAQTAEIERLRDALGIAIVLVAAELPYAPMLQHLRAALAGKAEQ